MNYLAVLAMMVTSWFYFIAYGRYIGGQTGNTSGMLILASVQFLNVIVGMLIFISIDKIAGPILFVPIIAALGTALGAQRARGIALAGLAEYERHQRDMEK